MKSSQTYEREVEKLRLKHTEHFNRNQWIQMQTIGRKIRDTWAAFHTAKARGAAK